MPDTSTDKGIQTMKFGQLIEYNTKNIFLEKLRRNVMFKLQSFAQKKFNVAIFSKISIKLNFQWEDWVQGSSLSFWCPVTQIS